jgi:hypothetical protein
MKLKRTLQAALVLAFAGATLASGCDANEPDAFGIHFQNDLGRPVVLALCHSDHSAKCEHPYYRDQISPGSTYAENISPDVRTEWAIESPSGALLRCVVLYWRHYPGSEQRVRLSQAPGWAWPCSRATTARPNS